MKAQTYTETYLMCPYCNWKTGFGISVWRTKASFTLGKAIETGTHYCENCKRGFGAKVPEKGDIEIVTTKLVQKPFVSLMSLPPTDIPTYFLVRNHYTDEIGQEMNAHEADFQIGNYHESQVPIAHWMEKVIGVVFGGIWGGGRGNVRHHRHVPIADVRFSDAGQQMVDIQGTFPELEQMHSVDYLAKATSEIKPH